jgi:hypothetical protein
MRLLKWNSDSDFSLTKDLIDNIPPYAILSHTWGADGEEITFNELMDCADRSKGKAGYNKIRFCGEQARLDGLEYIWVDTCCINKSNNTELCEAINSMFRWYHNSAKCYVYLSDVSTKDYDANSQFSQFPWEADFQRSKWFTRGWTLQELIAPASVEFFSFERKLLGNKKSLERQIYQRTGISFQVLRGSPLSCFSVEERMSWRAQRSTKRQEDEAYSLLGIFDISMPLIYGEGRKKAFNRLYEEIDRPLKAESLSPTSVPCDIGLSVLVNPDRPDLE